MVRLAKAVLPFFTLLAMILLVAPRGAAAADDYDGAFHIETRPRWKVQATLAEKVSAPGAGVGTWTIYAPVIPELPSQSQVASRLRVDMNPSLVATEFQEGGFDKRKMLALNVDVAGAELHGECGLTVEYECLLHSRALKRGPATEKVSPLTPEEKQIYLSPTPTVDFNLPAVGLWMTRNGLVRREEPPLAFGNRVFRYLSQNCKYPGDTSSYAARRPSQVCRAMSSDCGGLAILFVAVMRANNLPARTLFGRWAISQRDAYGQYHAIAEFYVDDIGWVPVDVAGTIVHHRGKSDALFGNADGRFLTWHIDTDLIASNDCQHAWAQYPLHQWVGTGKFWKGFQSTTQWTVKRERAE